MKAGKLPYELLARLIQRLPQDPRVLLGPGIGRDAAAIDLGDGRVLVAKTDPVTFASEQIGRYVVHVNANDVACLGARPAYFLATVLLPEGSAPALAEGVLEQIRGACDALGVSLVGGHTEITFGLDRPIVSGAMLGVTTRERLVTGNDVQAGDHIILTKGIAVEGTAVIAREAPEALRAAGVPQDVIDAAAALLDAPGISVVREALAVAATGKARALHDPTEGGLSTGLHELSHRAGRTITLRTEDVPVLAETAQVCEALALDPMGLLASGALLAVTSADTCDRVRDAIHDEGVSAFCIGYVAEEGQAGIIDFRNRQVLPTFERDELARFLERGNNRPPG